MFATPHDFERLTADSLIHRNLTERDALIRLGPANLDGSRKAAGLLPNS